MLWLADAGVAPSQIVVIGNSIGSGPATEMAVRVTSTAIQVHGGVGITKDFKVERHFRNARVLPIPDEKIVKTYMPYNR